MEPRSAKRNEPDDGRKYFDAGLFVNDQLLRLFDLFLSGAVKRDWLALINLRERSSGIESEGKTSSVNKASCLFRRPCS